MLEVLNVSHRKGEPQGFYQLAPEGFGEQVYLFLHFLYPAWIYLDGRWQLTLPNACILYSPYAYQEYKQHNERFVNDFIIFKCDDTADLAPYAIPCNRLFYVSNPDELTHRIANLTYTITDKLIARESETIPQLLYVFQALAQGMVQPVASTTYLMEAQQRFIHLREAVRQNPKDWNVVSMATHVHLTRSRFSTLYSQFFQCSPSSDLIAAKVEHAKKHLTETDLPVSEIATACGYKSVEHFIRIFNTHVGHTPLQYRKAYRRRG